MSRQIDVTFGQKLAEAKRGFAQWRQQRRGREPIPDHLWRLAAEAAAVHGLCATARQLRLNAAQLKDRMADRQPGNRQAPRFVELPALALGSLAECVLEMEDTSGRKLRVHLKGEATAQAGTIGQMLWRDRP